VNNDEKFMKMALELAEKGSGMTSPNPMVGAIVVNNGEIIATGYHRAAGEPHAEVVALQNAGERAKEGTLYVNLEPCCHRGKTPPCVEKIMEAGIQEVVIGMLDPNPLVSGKGIKLLQEGGVKVRCGILEEESRRLNEVFIKYITRGEPFVLIKTAVTLDGKIATSSGDTRWITGEEARNKVHHLRNKVDGILVGIETVLNDDPALTTRLNGEIQARDATRIIIDSRARMPLDSRVVNNNSEASTIVVVSDEAPVSRCEKLKEHNVEVWKIPGSQGKVSLRGLMKALGDREITFLLVEGGGAVNFSFLEENLVDKVYFFIAPIICGGKEAPTSFDGGGVEYLSEAWKINDLQYEKCGKDLLLTGYPCSQEGEERDKNVYRNCGRTGENQIV